VDVEFRARNVLLHTPAEVGMNLAAETKCRDGIMKNLLGDSKVPQGSDDHVAADSGKAVKVENSHGIFWGGN